MSDGIGLLIFIALGILVVTLTITQTRNPYTLREMPAFQRLRRAIGLAVEDGKRMHVSLGRGIILSENFGSALIGLGALKRLTNVALISDRPPIATCGEGSLMILAQNSLRTASRQLGLAPENLPQKALLSGTTPFSYAIGSQMELRDQRVAVDLLIGHFGSEAALISDASHQQGNLSIAGSDDLSAQAIFAAGATYPLLGEEVFAAVAYMDGEPIQRASLQAQDLARWIVIGFLLIASVVKLVGL
ncbi:MAG: hypothetical protein N3D16_07515 [Anaerolineales bacterium]|nr:hypothetical protein [Anaerolineales bacterium]